MGNNRLYPLMLVHVHKNILDIHMENTVTIWQLGQSHVFIVSKSSAFETILETVLPRFSEDPEA